jgi:hypothetical protein
MSNKSKKEKEVLKCVCCGESNSEDDSVQRREKTNNIILCSECVMEYGCGWCDICGEVIDYKLSWELYSISKEANDRAIAQGFDGQHPQRDIVCPECYPNFRNNKKRIFSGAVFTSKEGDIEVNLTEEITTKLNEELSKSHTYLHRIVVLKGVLDFYVRSKTEKIEKEKDEKYRLSRKSLDEYGFSSIDEVAIEQLHQIIDQIHNQ